MIKHFPKGFLWGSASASQQVEGGITNSDWAAAARQGRVPSAGAAADHYNRFEEDFDIAKSLGQNAHRFSLEWSRIEPEEGRFDEKEIEHYRAVLEALHKRNLTPMVTLWHFSMPEWFARRGGFLAPDAPQIFARYCAFATKHLGDRFTLCITMNEPDIYSLATYVLGWWPPFKRNPFLYFQIFRALVRSHRAAYKAIKEARPSLSVGAVIQQIFFDANHNPLNILLKHAVVWFWNRRFLKSIAGYQDFIGVNHYSRYKFGMSRKEKKARIFSDMGWEVYPEAFYRCLRDLQRYHLPIYVTENGVADAPDKIRANFIVQSLFWMHRAIEEGMPIQGYFYWSLTDNYEWHLGFSKRFGLVEIDYETQKRTVRPSALVYKKICESNELELEEKQKE